MIYLQLFWEFFKIGLFSVGGGMATLPFLQDLSARTGWYDMAFISDMVAISESTPGPIGANMATYVGYNMGGVPGGIIATLGLMAPGIVIAAFVAKGIEKFRNNRYVDNAFYGLRPAVTGLIVAAFLAVVETVFFRFRLIGGGASFAEILDPLRLALFLAFFFAIRKFKKHPILYIAAAGVLGILLKL